MRNLRPIAEALQSILDKNWHPERASLSPPSDDVVRAAKKRIEKGWQGKCLECEEEISDARLKVAPWANLCVNCKSKDDKKVKEDTDQRFVFVCGG